MSYLYISLRTIIIFFILLFIIRILGKREVGQLSIFDLVILLIIADIGAMGIDNEKLFFSAILCLFVLLFLQKIFSKILLHAPKIRNIVDGNAIVLVKNGNIVEENLKKENYTIDDLINQMRTEGIMDLNEIRLAVLETSGKLSVFSKLRYDKIVLPIIISGKFDLDMINELGISEDDIYKMLESYNLEIKDILYCSSDGKKIISIKSIS